MKTIILFLLIGNQLFANCRIPELSHQNLNEAGVRHFVRQFADANLPLEEFACCLPSAFRSQYIVAHSSFAGQDSIPQSPRVIMTNMRADSNGRVSLPTAYFSINGGHPSLRQTQSVEMALVNPKTGQTHFYDISFASGRAEMSAANPALCLACHGSRGSNGVNGPHLIFDGPSVWPRFVNGLNFLSRVENHPTLPVLNQYMHRLQQESVTALAKNPRYKCLSSKIPDVTFLNTFDRAIEKLNSIKTASEIVQSKDYEKYKYAIFGAELCQSMLSDIDCQIQNLNHAPVKNCRKWIHPRRIRSFNQLTNIFSSIKDLNQIDKMDDVALQAFHIRKNEIIQTVQSSNHSNSIEKVTFEFRRGFADTKQHILPQNLRGLRSPILRKYAIDNELRGSQINFLTRFLFEARGIPVSQWSTDVVAGYQRSGVNLEELLKYESRNSSLRSVMRGDHQQNCESLRLLSWKATESLDSRGTQ